MLVGRDAKGMRPFVEHTVMGIVGIVEGLIVLGAIACAEETSPPADADRQLPSWSTVHKDQTAARVNEAPISVSDVQQLLDETDGGLSPDGALQALIRNELLAQEARRRGYENDPEVEDARRLALTRAVLTQKIEREISSGTIDEAQLRAYYEEKKARFVHGVKRKVIHFLALVGNHGLSDDEARSIAMEAYKSAKQTRSEADFRKAMEPLMKQYGNKVKLESLPRFEATSKTFVKPFVDATFAVPGVFRTSPPVKTRFGWHVIFVTEEIPAIHRPLEEVREELLQEMVPPTRRTAAAKLIRDLNDKTNIFIYEGELQTGETEP